MKRWFYDLAAVFWGLGLELDLGQGFGGLLDVSMT